MLKHLMEGRNLTQKDLWEGSLDRKELRLKSFHGKTFHQQDPKPKS